MSLFRCALPLLRFGFIALASRGTTGLRPSCGSCKTREAQSPRNSLDIYAYVKLIQKSQWNFPLYFVFQSTTLNTFPSAIMQGFRYDERASRRHKDACLRRRNLGCALSRTLGSSSSLHRLAANKRARGIENEAYAEVKAW